MYNIITDIVNEGKFDHCEGNFDQLMGVIWITY